MKKGPAGPAAVQEIQFLEPFISKSLNSQDWKNFLKHENSSKGEFLNSFEIFEVPNLFFDSLFRSHEENWIPKTVL